MLDDDICANDSNENFEDTDILEKLNDLMLDDDAKDESQAEKNTGNIMSKNNPVFSKDRISSKVRFYNYSMNFSFIIIYKKFKYMYIYTEFCFFRVDRILKCKYEHTTLSQLNGQTP